MNIHFQFIISLFAIVPLFIPLHVEYIDALDFDNDSLEQSISPYINTIKNENYKKQKINFSNILENNVEIEYTSKIELKEDNDNNSNKSTIKQENDTLIEKLSSYESLGIKLENYTPWTILAKSDKSKCDSIDLCFLYLEIVNGTNMPQLWIIRDSFESQTIKEYCKCNTLEDYVKYFYNNIISQFDNFSFINENQTTISGDRSATQLEYEFFPNDTKIHAITVFTNNNDSFYQLSYYGDQQSYSIYLDDFKKIFDIIEFILFKEL